MSFSKIFDECMPMNFLFVIVKILVFVICYDRARTKGRIINAFKIKQNGFFFKVENNKLCTFTSNLIM